MPQNTEEISWRNVRLVRAKHGYSLIFTDTMAIGNVEMFGKVKFKVAGHFPEKIIAEFCGMCLAEVNDVPYLNETQAGGYLMDTSGEVDIDDDPRWGRLAASTKDKKLYLN